MKVAKQSSLSWRDAPDIIGVEELSKILGAGEAKAREYFNKKDFPKIPGLFKADKNMAELYFKGIKVKDNSKDVTLNLILLELKKINEREGEIA